MIGVPLLLALVAQAPTDSSLARFYEARWLQPAWLREGTISRQVGELLEVVSRADAEGLDPADYLTPELDALLHRHLLPDETWRLDSLLTHTFFVYARDVSVGRVEPPLVDSQWTASPHGTDVVSLLEAALDADRVRPALHGLAPPQPGYRALRNALWRYRELARVGDWPAPLGQRLAVEGYDTTAGLSAAVRQFQTLHGLEADGIVGPETRAQLDIAPSRRAEQIALNLERWRWLPRALGERHIVVNSAAFSLQLLDDETVTFTARAIVGRPDWPTPILSATATGLVFRPVWRVPRTIALQELLPIIERDSSYLARQGFHIVDSQLVQEPGPANPLGGVKLVFWNPFSVFIHDTPTQPPFSERWRAFSHGCVRVEGADALAARLLPTWPADSIRAAMGNGRERWVSLPQSLPVHLVYWTAWAADDFVAFAADAYGWDEKLAHALSARRGPTIAITRELSP
jgi:L,D-transpeptidase YcbB